MAFATTVRDLIADFIATLAVRLPQWLAEAGLTLGIATPVVISQVAALVGRWANKIQHFVRALLNSLRRLHPMLDKLGQNLIGLNVLVRRLSASDTPNIGGAPGPGHPTSHDGAGGSASPGPPGSGWHDGDPIPPRRTGDDVPTDAKLLDRYRNESDPNEPFPFRPFRTPVHYMSAEEREAHRLFVDGDGCLRRAHDGSLFDTSSARTLHSGVGRAIFVMDGHGNLYATLEQRLGHIHHSSLLGGADVAGAGEIEVINGRLGAMTDQSGHYQPKPEMNDRVMESLRRQGLTTGTDFKQYGWGGNER